jgi:putative NADPH-quinone reductase
VRFLVVYCHPVETSFNAAVHRLTVDTLTGGGHEVRDLDLYAMGFNPVLSREERINYLDATDVIIASVHEHVEHLHWAEGIVFIFPTWFYGPPAMLKGWLERTWLPEVAFTVPRMRGLPPGSRMRHIRYLIGITTSGSPWWWLQILGDPGKRLLTRGLRVLFHGRCKTIWLQLYSMNNTSAARRDGFLQKVANRLARVK